MLSEQQVIEKLNSSPAVKTVRELAAKESVRAYLTGGALRDLFLSVSPGDWDFVIDSDPGEFARKVVNVALGKSKFYQTPFGNYGFYEGALGKLDFIQFVETSVDEYMNNHWDFTINSLVYDLGENKLFDRHGALADLRDRVIRSIGPLKLASNKYPLPLRAVRLSLLAPEFTIDQQTYDDIKANRDVVSQAPPYRIGNELLKILESREYLKGLRLSEELGLLEEVFKTFLSSVIDDDAGPPASRVAPQTGIDNNFYLALDELTAPFNKLSSSNARVLRFVVFLTAEIRRKLLRMPPGQRKSFLITKGEQLEKRLIELDLLPSEAFRIRMVTVGYLLGVISLFEDGAELEEAVEQSVETFGTWKGFFAAILTCADWVAHGTNGQGLNRQRLEVAGGILSRQAVPLAN